MQESDDSYEDLDLSLEEHELMPPPNGAAIVSPSHDHESGSPPQHLLLPDEPAERRDSTVRFADETKPRKDSNVSTPSRRSSKSKEEGRRMTFLNRLFSDYGMTSPRSTDSLRSASNGEVAAQMFTMQANDEPEVSKMFDGEDDESPLVSLANKDRLSPEQRSEEKVMFTLGDMDGDVDIDVDEAEDDGQNRSDADDESDDVASTSECQTPMLDDRVTSPNFPIVLVTDIDGSEKKSELKKKKNHK
jgi:hypothetical protein